MKYSAVIQINYYVEITKRGALLARLHSHDIIILFYLLPLNKSKQFLAFIVINRLTIFFKHNYPCLFDFQICCNVYTRELSVAPTYFMMIDAFIISSMSKILWTDNFPKGFINLGRVIRKNRFFYNCRY